MTMRTSALPSKKLACRASPLGVVVCDIEGGEVDLVQHESDVSSKRVKKFIVETHGGYSGTESTNNMLDSLDQIGFVGVHKCSDTLRSGNLVYQRHVL